MIIDSSPTGISGTPGDTERGIPLGNVTSQDFANITLNEVDQYVQRFLGIRYYTRYMDDMIAIVDGKDKARELKRNMEQFLIDRLKLEANPKKSQIFPLKQGVNAYGYKIWTTHKLVRDDSKRAMKRRIKAMDRKLQSGQMELEDVTQAVRATSICASVVNKLTNKYDGVHQLITIISYKFAKKESKGKSTRRKSGSKGTQ